MAVWRASSFNYSPSAIGLNSFSDWWNSMVTMSTKDKGNLDIDLLACVLWGIWKQRNVFRFEGKSENPIDVWKRTELEHFEFIEANHRPQGNDTNQNSPQAQGWFPPERGCIKINCDAAFSKESKRAGIVAVARDHEGVVVGGVNERIHSQNAFVAESQAIILGSMLAEQLGRLNTIIESDNKNAIRMVNGEMEMAWEAAAPLKDAQKAEAYSKV